VSCRTVDVTARYKKDLELGLTAVRDSMPPEIEWETEITQDANRLEIAVRAQNVIDAFLTSIPGLDAAR
jgi:hypothetical protein